MDKTALQAAHRGALGAPRHAELRDTSGADREAVEAALELLDSGEARVAEPDAEAAGR